MYSLDTRYRAIVHYNHFLHSLRKVARIYGVSKSSLQRWLKNSLPYKKFRKQKTILNEVKTCIDDSLSNNPFITMKDLSNIIASKCHLVKSRRTINRYVKKQNMSLKTAYKLVDIKHNNEDVTNFCNNYVQLNDQTNLISIDEAGFYLNDYRKKGWATKGKKINVIGDKSIRNRVKMTLILAISKNGIVGYELLNHNCKKVDFIKFVKSLHVPTNSSILMDNIAFHHSKEVKSILKSKKINTLYNLPYSPKTNPIENFFGVLKPLYRSKCPPIRGNFDYKQLIIDILRDMKSSNLSKYFHHVRKICYNTIHHIQLDEDFEYNGFGN